MPPVRPSGSPLFKLRLGATDAAPSLAGGAAASPDVGGTTSSTQAPMPTILPRRASVEEPLAPVVRADGWEEFPAAVHEDEAREYKSDSDFQSLIEQLANQIAENEGGSVRPRSNPTGAPTTKPSSPPAVKPMSRGEAKRAAKSTSTPAPTPAPLVAPAPVPVAASVASSVATSVASVSNVAVAEIAAEAAAPVDAPQHTLSEGSLDIADAAPAGPVEVPAIVEAVPGAPASGRVPVVKPMLEPVKRVVDRISASTEHEVIVPRPTVPALAAPALLPKIEAKPGAPRPTSPVDFHALLKDSNLRSSPSKLRKKRHPFRVLFKLVLVLGILGAGGYYAKLRFLDTKWKDGLKEIADDVSARRGLEWNHAVDVIALPADEYALRLASSMIGVANAESSALSGEWRAMGLTEGSVDLVAIGTAATADQPAFYDPIEQAIYEVDGLSPTLHEIALSRAMTNALLDQQVHWGRLLVSSTGAKADPSIRLGVRALFDGDALSIRAQTTASALNDPSLAATVSDEIAGMRIAAAPTSRGASSYGVALASSAGAAARWLFTDELTPEPLNRDRAEAIEVSSDAAIFDGVRGRAAVAQNPASAATPATAPATTSISTPAATTPPPVTTVLVGETLPTTPAAATTLPTIAASGSTSRGMIYWYYALAGRIDADVAWDAALRWQGDGTAVTTTADGQCVDSVLVTKDVADRDVLLSALSAWAALAPAAAGSTASAMNDTAIGVHSCDPGPTADTLVNELIPLFGHAPQELLVANSLRGVGLPGTEPARTCVISTIRATGAPALLLSSSVDRSLTEATVNDKSPEVSALIDTCATR